MTASGGSQAARRAFAALLVAGLAWMLVAGSRAGRFWFGFLADEPGCVATGECTSTTGLEALQRAAWLTLVPGAVVAGVGGMLLIGVVALTGTRPSGPPPLLPTGALGGLLGVPLYLVGLTVVFLSAFQSPPLGAAAVAALVPAGATLLTALLRRPLGGRAAVLTAAAAVVAATAASALVGYGPLQSSVGGGVVQGGVAFVVVLGATCVLGAALAPRGR